MSTREKLLGATIPSPALRVRFTVKQVKTRYRFPVKRNDINLCSVMNYLKFQLPPHHSVMRWSWDSCYWSARDGVVLHRSTVLDV
jgi:hypothetical protein